MSRVDEEIEVISLLVRHEEVIGELYTYFSQHFPEDKEFWVVLSAEERMHAQWLKDLCGLLGSGEVSFNEDRFDTETIQASLHSINQEVSRLKQEEALTTKDAFSFAAEMELRQAESKFYEVYESDQEQIKQLLAALKNAFLEHRRRIINRFKDYQ